MFAGPPGDSPIAANERALGLADGDVERWAVAALEAWRDAVTTPARERGEAAIEPWDWWWRAGEADRAVRGALPLERVLDVNRRSFAALGVDFDALGTTLRHDTAGRAGRRSLSRSRRSARGPRRRADGTWSSGAPVVLATYVDGGLGDLAELVHEGGHACHIAAIRTRPAYADWPDSDALTEALAEVVALDVAEPAWLARWIPEAAPLVGGDLAALPLRRRDARHRLGPVRDPAPRRPGPDAQRGLDGDHRRLPGDRAAPGVVVVGDARAAGPGARVHGELLGRGGARRGPAGGDPGGPGRLDSAATRAGTPGSPSTSTGSGRSAPPATCCATSSAGRTDDARAGRGDRPGPRLTSSVRLRRRSRRRCG